MDCRNPPPRKRATSRRIALPPITSSPRRRYEDERTIQKTAAAPTPVPHAIGMTNAARTTAEAKISGRGSRLKKRVTSDVRAGRARRKRFTDAQTENQHAEADAKR